MTGQWYLLLEYDLGRLRRFAQRRLRLQDGTVIPRAFWDSHKGVFIWDRGRGRVDPKAAPVFVWKGK